VRETDSVIENLQLLTYHFEDTSPLASSTLREPQAVSIRTEGVSTHVSNLDQIRILQKP